VTGRYNSAATYRRDFERQQLDMETPKSTKSKSI